jgi:predicted MFS family arabinose efflux permease
VDIFEFVFFIQRKTRSVIHRYRLNLRLFTRNAWLFLTGTFFMGMGFSGFMLLFNLYLKELGFAEGRIGNIIMVSTLGTLIMAIPSSIIIRRFPIKHVLIISTPIAMIAYFMQVTALQYNVIVASALAAGFASVFWRVAAAPFFMRNSTPQERPYLFSMQFAISLVAGVLGNLLGGFLPGTIHRFGLPSYLTYRYTLYVVSILIIAALIPYSLIKEKHAGRIEPMRVHSYGMIARLFLPNLVTGIGAGLSIPFLNLYFKDIFRSATSSIGIYYSLQQLLMITGLIAAPVIAERIGKIRTIVFSQLLSIPFFVILGLTTNIAVAVFAFLVRAALMNMAQPLFTNFAMEKVKPDEQPLTNGLLTIAWTAGWGGSASLGGFFIERFSYSVPFLTTSVLYLISTFFIHRFFSKTACGQTRSDHSQSR